MISASDHGLPLFLPLLGDSLLAPLGGSTGVELVAAFVVVLGFAGINWLNDIRKK